MVEVEVVRLVVVKIRVDKSRNVYQDPHKVSVSYTVDRVRRASGTGERERERESELTRQHFADIGTNISVD